MMGVGVRVESAESEVRRTVETVISHLFCGQIGDIVTLFFNPADGINDRPYFLQKSLCVDAVVNDMDKGLTDVCAS